jgi:hypothetical protein
MNWLKWQSLYGALMLAGMLFLFASGCDKPTPIAPADKSREKADVDVKIGGGEGVKVHVNPKSSNPNDEVNVQVGGGKGVKVDVDK